MALHQATLRCPTVSAALVLAAALGCSGTSPRGPDTAGMPAVESAEGGPEASDGAPADSAQQGEAPPAARDVPRPKGLMTLAEAQQYVLALVNRDRAAHGLKPVRWDDTAAKAGQRHADDMARHGYTGHHGTDGSVPEERYTAAGGDGMSMENAGCLGDAKARELDPDPRFSAASLERVHGKFMAEVPPADGHKRNILTPSHTSLGVGLSKVKGGEGEDVRDVACMAQEFVDDYGSYDPLPKRARVGDVIKVAGEVRAPATFAGVGISRVDVGKPRKPEELLKMGGYPIPAPFVMYFPKGYKTPKPVEVTGNRFQIQVPLDDKGRPGRYGVSVWATLGGSSELRMISLRTIAVEKK